MYIRKAIVVMEKIAKRKLLY